MNFGVPVSEEAPQCETSLSLPTIPLAEPASHNGSSVSCQTASLCLKAARALVRTKRGTLAPAAAVPVGCRNNRGSDRTATRRGRCQAANHRPAKVEKKK